MALTPSWRCLLNYVSFMSHSEPNISGLVSVTGEENSPGFIVAGDHPGDTEEAAEFITALNTFYIFI